MGLRWCSVWDDKLLGDRYWWVSVELVYRSVCSMSSSSMTMVSRKVTHSIDKPTDTHQYLSPNSCHPKHCTTSIPYSQALRLRRICLRREDFVKRLNELRDHLLAHGYDTNSVDHQIQREALIPHPQALQTRPWQQQPRRVPLVTTYHPRLTGLTKIINKHLPILHASKELSQPIPNSPGLVTYR